MNEKVTQAKEKANEIKTEIANRVTKQRLLVVFAVFLLFSGGVGAIVDAKATTATTPSEGTVYVGSSDGKVYALDAATGSVDWSFDGGQVFASDPVVENGTVYAGDNYGYLYSIDAETGTENWNYSTGEKIKGGATVVGDRVYVTGKQGGVWSLYRSNGTKDWNFTAGGNINGAPHISNDTVYVGAMNDRVYAINRTTGQQKWATLANDYFFQSPTVKNGLVYAGSNDGNMYAIYAKNGSTKWKYLTDGGSTSGGIVSGQIVANGTVYFGSKDTNIYAVDAETGAKEWQQSAGDDFRDPPTYVNGTVYAASYDNNLYALDAETGAKQWTFTVNTQRTSPTVFENTLYIGSEDNNTYAINATDGTKEWNYTTGAEIRSAPTIVPKGIDQSEGSRVDLGATSHISTWALDISRFPSDAELNLDITDYQEPNTTKEYRVWHIENGERTNVTTNATVTSENTSIVEIHSTNYTMQSGKVNATANVTAKYDGLTDTVTVTVAQIDMNYIDILPPAFWLTAIIVDPTMQWLFVAIMIGAVAGQMSRNKWAGMGTIQIVILIGWAIDLVDDGILMAGIAFLIFAGLITMQGSSGAEPIE